jgi:hypothetical protein
MNLNVINNYARYELYKVYTKISAHLNDRYKYMETDLQNH